MAKYTGWKKKYSYLDNYKKGMDGKYVYYGRHYIMEDADADIRRYKITAGIADVLLTALFVVGGFMDAGNIWSTWYVIIPYMLEAITIFLFLWKSVSLITEKYPVKEYMFDKTVKWFKPTLIAVIVSAVISVIGTVICMLVNSGTGLVKLPGCIMYLAVKVITGVVCVLAIKCLCGRSWVLDPDEELEQ